MTANLDFTTFEELVALLTPFMLIEDDRRALLRLTLADTAYGRINFAGAADTFTIQLINTLLQYGEVTPGKQAIMVLLETLQKRLGIDRQEEISQLQLKLAEYFKRRQELLKDDLKNNVSAKDQAALDQLRKQDDLHDATYHATITGSGSIAQGVGTVAAGQGGVAVKGNIRGSSILTGKGNRIDKVS